MRNTLAFPFAAVIAVSPLGAWAQDVADTIYPGGRQRGREDA